MKVKFGISIFLLVCATLAISSAATFFDEIEGASGSLKSCWRLQMTSLIQIPLAIHEYRSNPLKVNSFYKKNWWLIILVSFFFASLFSLWATSLEYTSIAHSISFMNSTPVLAIILQFCSRNKPNLYQIIGVMISFGGLLTLALTISSDKQVTVFGDFLAFLSSFCFLGTLYCGKRLRKEVMWAYVCPTNFLASLFSYVFSTLVQKDSPSKFVRWMYTFDGVFVLCLGILPGNVGHATLSYLVKTISPLLISTFINFDPLFGSLIGWFAGYQATPTIWTWIGGSLLISGNTVITIGEKKSANEQQDTSNEEISIGLASDS